MRLCLVTETFPPDVNGVAMTLQRLAAELEKRGHQVHVICPWGDDSSAAGCGLPGRHEGCTTRVRGWKIPSYPEARMGWIRPGRLRRLWQEERPDMVHIATEGPLGWVAMKTAKGLDIPVVASFHTNFHHYAGHYGAGWLEGAVAAYLRAFHNKAACNLVPDPGLMKDLDALGFRKNVYFGRGVDTQLFHPDKRDADLRAAWNVKDGEKVIIHVSRVAVEKDIPFILELYLKIRQQHPSVKCVVVGDGPKRNVLEKAFPEVIFTGYLFGEDLARAYASADFFFFASQTETFGNVLTEALASGLAVLAYDYAAARQYIVNGQNGFTVPLGDWKMFEHSACGFFREENPENLRRVRLKGRETAAHIPWSGVVDAYLENLRLCLVGNASSGESQRFFSPASAE